MGTHIVTYMITHMVGHMYDHMGRHIRSDVKSMRMPMYNSVRSDVSSADSFLRRSLLVPIATWKLAQILLDLSP